MERTEEGVVVFGVRVRDCRAGRREEVVVVVVVGVAASAEAGGNSRVSLVYGCR
jgi:hypothetical protein